MLNQTDSEFIPSTSINRFKERERERERELIISPPSLVVRYLSTEPPPPQHIVFSLLHAYVFSKSRRGNLPSETLSKLLSIQRKLLIQRGSKPFPPESPIARAFEAMRIQMLVVNKKWMVEGVSAFGPLVNIFAHFFSLFSSLSLSVY